MKDSVLSATPPAFWELLLNRVDPHHPASETHDLNAQVLCGRWFALHRLNRDKRLVDVANDTRIEPQSLLLLEAGVASEQLVDHTKLQALCSKLADRAHTATWIEQIGRIALGRPLQPEVASRDELLGAVQRDIAIYQTSSGRGAKLSLQDDLVNVVLAALRVRHHELPKIWEYVRTDYQRRQMAIPGSLADLAIVLGDMEEARLIDSMRSTSPGSSAQAFFYPTLAVARAPSDGQPQLERPPLADSPEPARSRSNPTLSRQRRRMCRVARFATPNAR